MSKLRADFGKYPGVFRAVIPDSVVVAEAAYHGVDVYSWDKRSKAAIKYEELTDEILRRMKRWLWNERKGERIQERYKARVLATWTLIGKPSNRSALRNWFLTNTKTGQGSPSRFRMRIEGTWNDPSRRKGCRLRFWLQRRTASTLSCVAWLVWRLPGSSDWIHYQWLSATFRSRRGTISLTWITWLGGNWPPSNETCSTSGYGVRNQWLQRRLVGRRGKSGPKVSQLFLNPIRRRSPEPGNGWRRLVRRLRRPQGRTRRICRLRKWWKRLKSWRRPKLSHVNSWRRPKRTSHRYRAKKLPHPE